MEKNKMEYHRECLVCGAPFQPESDFCISCGAKKDEGVLDEARSIKYLINEIDGWPRWLTIQRETQLKLKNHYEDRLVSLTNSVRWRPRVKAVPVDENPAPPPILFVASQPTEENEPAISPLETVIATQAESQPPQLTFVQTIATQPEPKPSVAPTTLQSVIVPSTPVAQPVFEKVAAPPVDRRSLSELVAEN